MSSRFLPIGSPAPSFEMTAIHTRRVVSLGSCSGTPLLLVFVSFDTREQVRDISQAVRDAYPDISQVIVANVINLLFVPSLARKMAENRMESAIKQAIKEIPPPYTPAEYLILLPDWKGSLARAYRISSSGDQVALVMIDGQGIIQGHYQGNAPAQAAVELIAEVVK
jgi:hypothetical protein